MPSEEPLLHPYDILANPKRRRILDALSQGDKTYMELMRESGMDDSGKFSYYLGTLARYIHHVEEIYSLSFEGSMLLGAVKDFEEKAYGLMGNIIFSGDVGTSGLLTMTYSIRISIMGPAGDMLQKMIQRGGFDKEKATAAMMNRMKDQVGEKLGDFKDLSVDFDKEGILITIEHEKQGFEYEKGWYIGLSLMDTVTQDQGDSSTVPVPGLHFRAAGSISYPGGAEVKHEFPDEKTLKKKGLEVYEYTKKDNNLRWRVRKGPALCLGDSRLIIDGKKTMEILELENHLSTHNTSSDEIKKLSQELPRAVSGTSKFKIPD